MSFWKFSVLVLFSVSLHATLTITPRQINSQWSGSEFTVTGAPTVENPFDPDQITLRATFTSATGKATTVDGFWYQDYRTALSGGYEALTAQGAPEWRVRFTPDESGLYQIAVQVTTPSASDNGSSSFTAAAASSTNRFKGVVKIASNAKFFELAGQTLPLNGANVCWHGGRGTFDYLDWFPAMNRNGENYARLWMCPWAFGIEETPTSLNRYALDHAWQLDRVMRIAETNGIFIMLCLEYHGMFQTQVDQFGGNNAWVNNPYNSANGGPCATPNDFFTNTTARDIYKKRLRYLIARYGASPNLLCWEFFNEIDNDYNLLNATSVASWHSALAPWLKQNDPYKRLVTTSLTGNSDRPEIWNATGIEFAQYHSYGQAQPVSKIPPIIQSMRTRYNKPVLVGEYGIDSSGFHAELDPYFRGLRQGIWAGLLGLSAGTSMSWWWEEIHARNLYPIYNSVAGFLKKTALGQGAWNPISFVTNGDPPAFVGDPITNAPLFTVTLNLSGQWGLLTSGAMAVPDPDAAGRAPAILDAFFQGTSHPELRNPCKISAYVGANGRLVMHLNSVSDGAIMQVLVDGVSKFYQSVPNPVPNSYEVNNEYNTNYFLNLAAGKHLIEIRNAGADWFYLDWIRLENLQPATYLNNWTPSPVSIGVSNPAEALVYVVNPAVNFPANATTATIAPLTNAVIHLTNWTAGAFTAIWQDAKTLQPVGKTSGTTTNSVLDLPLPTFSEDIAGRIVPANRVSQIQPATNSLNLSLAIPAPANSSIEETTDFTNWTSSTALPFDSQSVSIPTDAATPAQFFRLTTAE